MRVPTVRRTELLGQVLLALTAGELGLYVVGGGLALFLAVVFLVAYGDELLEAFGIVLFFGVIGGIGAGVCALLIEVGVLSGW